MMDTRIVVAIKNLSLKIFKKGVEEEQSITHLHKNFNLVRSSSKTYSSREATHLRFPLTTFLNHHKNTFKLEGTQAITLLKSTSTS